MNLSHPFAVESLESRQLMAAIAVLNTADSGSGSLRDAIATANAGDTIDLSGLTGTITLQSTLTIDKSLTLAGPSDQSLWLDGNDAVQIMHMTASSADVVTISNLNFAHGNSASGGAIQDDSNALSLTNCTFYKNIAESANSETIGGAIATWGTLTIQSCLFQKNSCIGNGNYSMGGAVWCDATATINATTFDTNTAQANTAEGGALYLDLDATLTNCTIVNNLADCGIGGNTASGAAIVSRHFLTLTNCTVSGNVADGHSTLAGGIYSFFGTTIQNSIIAQNTATDWPDLYSGSDFAGDHNLVGIGDDSNFTDGVDGNLVGSTASPLDPMLGTLADNGGPTQTMALQAGSPAIDAGNDANAPTTDQRGQARINISDIGAFEYETPAPTESSGITVADGVLTIAGRSTANDIHAWTRNGGAQLRIVFNGSTKNYDTTTLTSLIINGSDGDDNILVNTGNIPANVFGGAGNDTLLGGDEADTLVGGDGDDYLSGNGGNDALYGDAGNDNLFGGDGNDLLFGGDGNDTLRGEFGNDTIRGEAGTNSIFAKDDTADIIRTASALDTFKLDAIDKLFTVAA